MAQAKTQSVSAQERAQVSRSEQRSESTSALMKGHSIVWKTQRTISLAVCPQQATTTTPKTPKTPMLRQSLGQEQSQATKMTTKMTTLALKQVRAKRSPVLAMSSQSQTRTHQTTDSMLPVSTTSLWSES